MNNIESILSSLRKQWLSPREAIHRGKPCPFLLTCEVATQPAELDLLEHFPMTLPEDVREFWRIAQGARLFVDIRYGQWGLEVLSPKQALEETGKQLASRPREFTKSDLVIGRFYGDSDRLILLCDPQESDFGSVRIAQPLDKRNEWSKAASSFEDFLQQLVKAQGDKYWEP